MKIIFYTLLMWLSLTGKTQSNVDAQYEARKTALIAAKENCYKLCLPLRPKDGYALQPEAPCEKQHPFVACGCKCDKGYENALRELDAWYHPQKEKQRSKEIEERDRKYSESNKPQSVFINGIDPASLDVLSSASVKNSQELIKRMSKNLQEKEELEKNYKELLKRINELRKNQEVIRKPKKKALGAGLEVIQENTVTGEVSATKYIDSNNDEYTYEVKTVDNSAKVKQALTEAAAYKRKMDWEIGRTSKENIESKEQIKFNSAVRMVAAEAEGKAYQIQLAQLHNSYQEEQRTILANQKKATQEQQSSNGSQSNFALDKVWDDLKIQSEKKYKAKLEDINQAIIESKNRKIYQNKMLYNIASYLAWFNTGWKDYPESVMFEKAGISLSVNQNEWIIKQNLSKMASYNYSFKKLPVSDEITALIKIYDGLKAININFDNQHSGRNPGLPSINDPSLKAAANNEKKTPPSLPKLNN